MAIWLIRAGSHGEYEQTFLQEPRVDVTLSPVTVRLLKMFFPGYGLIS